MIGDTIRAVPLTKDEKKELTNLLSKLKLAGNGTTGQIIIHLSQGSVSAVQPMMMLR